MSKGIVLVGFMGAGKTTIGTLLAEKLSMPMIDTDSYIEEMSGMSVSEIFAQYGEMHFRELETQAIKRLIEMDRAYIVSCGGGMVLRPENRALLKTLGIVVYLNVSPKTVALRLSGDTTRPLLQGADAQEKIKSLLASREMIYEAAADWQVCVDNGSPEEICVKILGKFEKST